MEFINAMSLNRKSGGAEWRDLQFSRKVENLTFQQSLALDFEVCSLGPERSVVETCGLLFRQVAISAAGGLLRRANEERERFPRSATIHALSGAPGAPR
jgi:hypothetical protein